MFNNSFGLYIHVPFCKVRCNYCDFYSQLFKKELVDDYLIALEKEIELYAKKITVRDIKTIYFGGGTPSLLSSAQVGRIINKIEDCFSHPKNIEITLEANPSSLNKEKVIALKEAGVNRLSLGVQSFLDKDLNFLGRIHTSIQAVKIIEEIRKIFSNYSIDLIFAIPGQTLYDWKKTLKTVLKFKPPHLSLYNLQIEEGTLLGDMLNKGKISQVDNELDAEMYLGAIDTLEKYGYEHYEISSFAQKGFRAEHNSLYWKYEPYLGLGPGAHSFNSQIRFYNWANLSLYIKKLFNNQLPIEEKINLSPRDLMAEMIFMGLRLQEGISLVNFEKRFGYSLPSVYFKEIKKMKSEGFICLENDRLKLSAKGLLFGNEVFMEFLP